MNNISSIIITALLINSVSFAQLTPGSIAPDFTITDIDGTTHNLYDILDEGKPVLLDLFATWCGPCWSFAETGVFEEFDELYGANGDNSVFTIAVESDPSTSISELTSSDIGDWTSIIHYTIANDDDIGDAYELAYYPTIYLICPDRTVTEIFQGTSGGNWTVETLAEEVFINTCPAPVEGLNAKMQSYDSDLVSCGGAKIEPIVTILNMGTEDMTACSIQTIIGGSVVNTYNWNGSLATFASAQVTLPEISDTTSNVSFNVVMDGDLQASDDHIDIEIEIATEAQSYINIQVNTNFYAWETSWDIRNSNGSVVFSGSYEEGTADQWNGGGPDADMTHDHFTSLDEGCYTFNAYDSYGDGQTGYPGSGAEADGSIIVTDANGDELLFITGNWESQFTFVFEIIGNYMDLIFGCTNPDAVNYNIDATEDDGSCIASTMGCTDPYAINYNPNTTIDDGSCQYFINCNDLFISEYVEGSSNNHAIEIYNPTNESIDLSNYSLSRWSNGQTTPLNTILSGIIEANDAFVIGLDKRDPDGEGYETPLWNGWYVFTDSISGLIDSIYTPEDDLMGRVDLFICPNYEDGTMYFNGNDAVTLETSTGNILDIIGKIGEDPGEAWGDENDAYWTKDQTLIRKASVTSGFVYDPTQPYSFDPTLEWDSLPNNTFIDLGFHDCACNSNTNSELYGCIDELACNYNSNVNLDDGSCLYGAENVFLNAIVDEYNLSSNDDYTYFEQGTSTLNSASIFIQGTNLFSQGTNLLFNASTSILELIEENLISLFNYFDDNSELYDCDELEVQNTQCDLPGPYENGPTGSNLTVWLDSGFIASLNFISPNPYIVALTSSNLVVGSSYLAPESLINGMQSVAVWGDDSFTNDVIEGPVDGEIISLQIVDGIYLYELNSLPYVTNGILPINSGEILYVCAGVINGCTNENAENYDETANTDDGSCNFGGYNDLLLIPPVGSIYNSDSSEVILPSAYLEANYNEDIIINVSELLSLEFAGEVIDLPINFLQVTSVIPPSGIEYNCSSENCYFQPNTSGNLILSGIPNEIGIHELDLNLLMSIDGAPLGINIDIDFSIPYTGGNTLLDIALSGDYSSLNNIIPTFFINVEPAENNPNLDVYGCTDVSACNYNSEATIDDGSCVFAEPYYNCDATCINDSDGDGICDELEMLGCTDPSATNYNSIATDDDGSCIYIIYGCTNTNACNYEPDATNDDGSCTFAQMHYSCDGICINDSDGDGICNELEVLGCTDPSATNYNSIATDDDGSCIYIIYGCTNTNACNYEPNATNDDGSCTFAQMYYNCDGTCINDSDSDGVCDELEVLGCTDPSALNYDPNATDDNGSCTYEISGCTYPDALNYNEAATLDDGSCVFEFNVTFENIINVTNIVSIYNIYTVNIVLGTEEIALGDLLGAFYVIDGVLVSGGYVVYDGSNSIEIALVGDDPNTEDIEGFQEGQEIIWIVQQLETDINYLIDVITESEGFVPNTEEDVTFDEVSPTATLGCTDPTACNYNEDANLEDGSCKYANGVLDCDGNCVNDVDLDAVCDEEDNCIEVVNPVQTDSDNDGDGDACDYDDGIGVEELEVVTPQLIKMIDVLGREQQEHNKGSLLFYIYDNGMVEKRVIH